ncbi:MAG: methionine sulfoxide reductase heme-binding subunit [Pseudonocardiales bacterium]|nr:methionine sulfoxide reductase heme-binding subunit [Pseudonocardiales bacterium]
MTDQLVRFIAEESPHDAGVHQVAALSAHLAFVFLCVGLCWGVFTSTGWLHRLTGRQATRSSHLVLVTLAMAFAAIHALAFLFMTDSAFTVASLTIPLHTGKLGEAAGVVAFELMMAIVITTALQRLLNHRRWLWLHRMAYPALGLSVLHSFVGAVIDGHLAELWLAGSAFLVPTLMLTALRFVPPKVLTGIGLVRAES